MEFLHKIASYTPVPAGGAAVANSFCLAVALIYKVVLFESERNLHTGEPGSNLMQFKKEIEKLLKDAERVVDADSEAYMQFAQSRRNGNTVLMNQHFNEIIEISMSVMEKSEVAFEWIRQLRDVIPQQMVTHLLVASELLMGSINGTVHIIRENLKSLKASEKRENYLKRLNDLHNEYRNRYKEIMDSFPLEPEALNAGNGQT